MNVVQASPKKQPDIVMIILRDPDPIALRARQRELEVPHRRRGSLIWMQFNNPCSPCIDRPGFNRCNRCS